MLRRLTQFAIFAVICGGNTGFLLKQAAEICNVLISTTVGDVGDVHVGGLEQMAGLGNPSLGDGFTG